MITKEAIDQAVDDVKLTTPPEAPVELHDYKLQFLEDLLDRCISENIHLYHPRVVERFAELKWKNEKDDLHKHMCRYGTINTLGDLRAITSGLPDNMPLICTGDTGNRQGLQFYSNEWLFQSEHGGQVDIGRAVYSIRISGIPELEWVKQENTIALNI
ncbi:MAG: hypothetical protein EOO52_13610 [Gammaproteobacteria bacterium]|nr:MAG: hypothetical protein EOO52_13610 [Gammaproteobacteria bacterium]